MSLSVKGVTVTYRLHPVVRDVSFVAPMGAVTGLLGPNGAGKSTVIKAALGLVQTESGTIRFFDRELDDVRHDVAYLPQRADVDWTYPAEVRDVVAMGRYPHLGLLKRTRRSDRTAIDDALERVGLSDLRTRHIGELSGGQQQRVFLARALAQGASTLILDEPFAAVDEPTVVLLTDLLRSLAVEDRVVLVVVHDLDIARTLCDQVVLLNRAVQATGAAAEVLDPQLVQRVFNPGRALQSRGER